MTPLGRLSVIGICISTLCMSRVLGWTGTRVSSCSFLPFRGASRGLLKDHSCGIRNGRLSGGTSALSSLLVPRCSLSDTRDAMDFRVVTYNILCSHLADQKRFPLCEPSNLDAATRLERVKQRLEGEVAEGAVICLQEVSITWAGDLHVFFLSRGYAFVAAHYGAHFNNYMGVALAWPVDKFEALKVDITRVSETRRWGRDPALDAERKRPSPVPSTEWGGPLGVLMKLTGMGEGGAVERGVGRAGNWEREPDDPWKMAEKRFNQALFARLRRRGGTSTANNGVFCVGTYHMPCLFNFPQVMVIHTSMVIKHLAGMAGSDPLVFGGDFNFSPSSECYKLATEGDLSSSSPEFPELLEWEKRWSPKTGVRLLSAYKEVEGQEPNFTNNAKVEDYEPFIDTLDYIFHTSGLTATKVLPLKHRDEVHGPFPTREEPSDHVLIAAEYTITGPKTDV